jgi:hypothetical protein
MGPPVHAPREQPAQAALPARVAVLARPTLSRATLSRVLTTRLATFPPHSRFTSASTRYEPRCPSVADVQPF